MNCKKCNEQLADDALFCPACGDRTAVHAQEEKLQNVQKRTVTILKEKIKTNLFMNLAICLSVIAFSQLVTVITGIATLTGGAPLALIGFGLNVLFCVFHVLAAVGAWKLCVTKGETVNTADLRWFKFYPALQHVIAILINIVAGFVAVGILITSFIGNSLMSMIGGFSNDLSNMAGSMEGGESASDALGGISQLAGAGGGMMVVIGILLAAIIMFVSITHSLAWGRLKKHLNVLINVNNGNQYTAVKVPSVILYIWGSLYFLVGLFMFNPGSGILSTFSTFATGVFLFVAALFFRSIHTEEVANNSLVNEERAKLEAVINAVDAELHRQEKERREAEEAKLREMQMSQQQQQDKMQQMMMAMMMNNMAQNKNVNMQDMMNAMNAEQVASDKTEEQ